MAVLTLVPAPRPSPYSPSRPPHPAGFDSSALVNALWSTLRNGKEFSVFVEFYLGNTETRWTK